MHPYLDTYFDRAAAEARMRVVCEQARAWHDAQDREFVPVTEAQIRASIRREFELTVKYAPRRFFEMAPAVIASIRALRQAHRESIRRERAGARVRRG